MEDFTKPDKICDGYSSAWPLWVIPKGVSADGTQDEIGIQAGRLLRTRTRPTLNILLLRTSV
jgi:hypothetical protein